MSLLSSLKPGLTGLDQLLALLDAGRQPSIHETLNIALISAKEGAVVVEARPSESHLNAAGTVAGGYVATILDAACGCAAHTALPPDTAYTTLELKLSYHRAITPRTGKLRAEGKLLSSGRRAAFSEAKLFDGTGRLLASASSSLLVLPSRGEEPLGSAGPVPQTRELPSRTGSSGASLVGDTHMDFDFDRSG
jgi:uncharacterized protein (TIGR00369 family)